MIEKYAAREIKREIGRILWEVWDPIGVNTYPAARDEYDGYVNDVFIALVNGVTSDDLAKHLFEIASERMQLRGVTPEAMQPTVAALRAIPLGKQSS